MQTDDPNTLKHGGADKPSPSRPAEFLPVPADVSYPSVSTIAALAEIPEEEVWLGKQKSKRTRRAYKQDVQHFMRTLQIRSYEDVKGGPRISHCGGAKGDH
jgi:hypothetical protein